MKKILAILLAVVMSLSMITPVFAYTDTEDSNYAKPIENLSGLGVINGYEDGTFKPEKVVTRAEMAKLLVVCLGLETGASILEGTTSFDDVSTDHWAIGYINVATQYGLIKGDGDGKFRPDDTVNYAEAITMCLRALKYNSVIESKGQWPTNYLDKANELKMFADVEKINGTDGANRGSVAQIMWNMLNTRMWEATSESENDGLNYTKGETMLVNKFPDFISGKGTVADPYVVNYVEEGEVTEINVIDNNTVDVEFDNTTEIRFEDISPLAFVEGIKYDALFTVEKIDGANVNVAASLYRNASKVVFGLVTKATAEEVTIDGKEYEEANDEINIALEGKVVKLTLDKNNKVDEVEVYASTNEIVIEEIKESKDGKTTNYDVYTASDNNKITVDNTVKENIFVKYDVNGKTEIIEQSDIKAGMVMEKYTNGSITGVVEVGNIYVLSDETISGKVSKIKGTTLGTDLIATIDGNEYRFDAKSLILLSSKTTPEDLTYDLVKGLIGEEIDAKLNVSNEIIFIEAEDSVIAKNYGFITKAWMDTVEGVNTYKVRIMDLQGKTTDYVTYDFDGKAPAQLTTTTVGTFIQYELQDGKIVKEKSNGTAGVANTAITATRVSNKNETAKTFVKGGETIAWDSNTKGYQFEINAADFEVDLKAFDIADMENGNDYIVIKDDTTNIAEYVLYQGTVTTDKVYGIVVEKSIIVDKDGNDDTLYGTIIYDIATEEEIELTLGTTENTTINKGAVISYEEGTDGYDDIIEEIALGTTVAPFTTIREIGDNKEISIVGGKVLVTGNTDVLFIDANGEIDETKDLDDITEADTIYGVSTVEKENTTDADLYNAIVVVPGTATVITHTNLLNLTTSKDFVLAAKSGTPVTELEDEQFTATVTWSPAVTTTFAATTVYTATVTITPKAGYTLQGITANAFTVTGATSATNLANSEIVTIVCPTTGA